jgi:hypothetical protein
MGGKSWTTMTTRGKRGTKSKIGDSFGQRGGPKQAVLLGADVVLKGGTPGRVVQRVQWALVEQWRIAAGTIRYYAQFAADSWYQHQYWQQQQQAGP